jgi:hypothetical protein
MYEYRHIDIYIYKYYSDDVLSFKTDVISAFKYMFKKYKAKGANTPIYEHFNLLLEDNFEDMFPKRIVLPVESIDKGGDKGGKKRIRDTDIEENTKRMSKKEEEVGQVVSMTYNQKMAVKSIVNMVIKNPLAEPFLYPVDSSVFPEYYEIIKKPMDLSTIKERITEYVTVEEALGDIRQIWENCRLFNAEVKNICLCIYIFMYIYMYLFIYIFLYIYVYVCIHMYIYVYICI